MKADRLASGDPRLSIEERYGTQEGYVCAVTLAAKNSVKHRFLLQADADELIEQATAADILPSGSVSSPEDNQIAQSICSLFEESGEKQHKNKGEKRHKNN